MPTVLTYATVDDMIKRFSKQELVELTDFDNIPPSTIDSAKVEQAIDDATAVVDSYVGMVYKLPLLGCMAPQLPGQPPVYAPPPQLTRLTCDIARYYLYDDLAPEHEVFRRRESSIKELQAIAKGESMLSCPMGGSPGELISVDPLNIGGETWYTFSDRKVTDATTKGYK